MFGVSPRLGATMAAGSNGSAPKFTFGVTPVAIGPVKQMAGENGESMTLKAMATHSDGAEFSQITEIEN